MKTLLRRIWSVLRPHQHSIYTRCFVCGMWGINMPGEGRCGNCGSTDTYEYYPTGKDAVDLLSNGQKNDWSLK